MKKRLISAAFALLLLLALSSAAWADTSYPAPGDIMLGSSINHLAATVDLGCTVNADAGSLPPGCYLETEVTGSGINLYLRGTPSAIGSFNCVFSISNGNTVVCPVNIVAARPSVSVSGDISCFAGDLASVSVNVSGGGKLSYQWYSNSVDSTEGGSVLIGQNSPSLQVDTSVYGTEYYYCMVISTIGDYAFSVTSDTVAVTVREPSVCAVSVYSMPEKLSYFTGESLDSKGLRIRVDYSDGNSKIITQGFDVYPASFEHEGQQSVDISYQGHSCTFTVSVEEAEEVIEGIGVLKMPEKISYEIGEKLETKGLSIRVRTNKGEHDVTEGFECSPTEFDKVGEHKVTVSYEGKTCTFTVTVEAEEKPVSIAVATTPKKMNYTVGESLDTSGLVLRLTTSRNKTENISSGFSCQPQVLSKEGRQQITVTYGELSCTFTVSVTAAAAPSPTPPGSQPSSPAATPAPTPHIIHHESYDTGNSHGFFIAVIILCLLTLAGLGAYVFIMNRGGKAYIDYILQRLNRR